MMLVMVLTCKSFVTTPRPQAPTAPQPHSPTTPRPHDPGPSESRVEHAGPCRGGSTLALLPEPARSARDPSGHLALLHYCRAHRERRGRPHTQGPPGLPVTHQGILHSCILAGPGVGARTMCFGQWDDLVGPYGNAGGRSHPQGPAGSMARVGKGGLPPAIIRVLIALLELS